MSASEEKALWIDWKKRAEIDYIPLFISLWLSLNAWMRDSYQNGFEDRKRLNLLKRGENPFSDRFAELIYAKDPNGSTFRGSFGELQRALLNANIPYENRWPGEIISFASCPISWNNGSPNLESVLKTKNQQAKIQIDADLWVENDTGRLFAAYIEIVYQIRCALFHGQLAPQSDNERVIRHIYITLSMIMEHV